MRDEPAPSAGPPPAGPPPERATARGDERSEALAPGTRVDVRDRFQGTWSRGFVVAEVTGAGYRVERVADRTAVPGFFPHEAVRREKKRRSNWWY